MENKKVYLTWQDRAFLERQMFEEGFLPDGYVHPEIIEKTTIKCPMCGGFLTIRCAGNSYEITCPMHGSIAGARGI